MNASPTRAAICGVVSITGVAILVPNLLRVLTFEESALGIGLARWTVEYYDGEFDIETPAGGGTRAICRLQAA